ncbi:MAG TPA: type I-B CRISPR-associated protein Cas7/Cst2/DevR, partial [Cytophagaceae bacterium]
YWWRETLKKDHAWNLSPITRESKIAFTDADPLKYSDDDVFGYMKAAKDTKLKEDGTSEIDSKGKEKKEDVTVTRISPLKNSVLMSVASTSTVENWSSMSRQEGDAVPYSKEEYSAVMKGMFSVDLAQVGTFATYNKTGFKNLTIKLQEEGLANGSKLINDPFVKDIKGNPKQLVQMPLQDRLKRIQDTIRALKTISGGAMQTNNMADVTPKFIILATTNSGNHPFSHIAKAEGLYNNIATLSIDAIKEVLEDYKDQIIGKVFIGKRAGFLDECNADLAKLSSDKINVSSINQAIDGYCHQLETQLS